MATSSKLFPRTLATPSGLGPEAAEKIADAINPVIADLFALFLKTKNFHWHLAGPHYRDYHLLLDEQATQLFVAIDILAERVRKLGAATIHSIGEVAKLSHIADDDRLVVSAQEMLRALCEDNQRLVAAQRTAHAVCDEHDDIATASLLENFVDETEHRIWFLHQNLV